MVFGTPTVQIVPMPLFTSLLEGQWGMAHVMCVVTDSVDPSLAQSSLPTSLFGAVVRHAIALCRNIGDVHLQSLMWALLTNVNFTYNYL